MYSLVLGVFRLLTRLVIPLSIFYLYLSELLKWKDKIESVHLFVLLTHIQRTKLSRSNLITHPSSCPAPTPRAALPLA